MFRSLLRLAVVLGALGLAGVGPAYADAASRYQIFVPPNADNVGRDVMLVVTAVQPGTTLVEIIDDAADGDDDDTVLAQPLTRGESYLVRIRDGAVNDDAGGAWDGDFFTVEADGAVIVQMATASNWQHDWAPSESGAYVGQSFFLYAPRSSGADLDVDVFAYADDVRVTVTDVTTTPRTSTGHITVDLASEDVILDSILHLGEDLRVRRNLGLDVLDQGRTYWVQATGPVSVQYGHLDQVRGGNQARDGGGFVPSSNGSATGSLYYFAIPHNPALEREKELRVVCYDDATTVTLEGAGRYDTSFSPIGTATLDAGEHADWVGASDPVFRDARMYRLSVSPAYQRCTVFEGNWMETGSPGTSDFASSVSSANGLRVGQWFTPYLGPPGFQFPVTGINGAFSHLYVTSRDGAQVTVRDLDTDGTIVNEIVTLPAGGYHDVRVDQATYTQLTTGGRRPYLEVRSSAPVSVVSGNFNDNWMTYLSSVMEPDPTVTVALGDAELTCGAGTTLNVDCAHALGGALDDVVVELELPSELGFTPGTVPAALGTGTSVTSGGRTTWTWTTPSLAGGAGLGLDGTLDLSCGASCLPPALASVTVSCTGTQLGRTYADVETANLALRPAVDLEIEGFLAQDDASGGGPVALSFEASGGGATASLELTRAGSPDGGETSIATWSRPASATPTTFGHSDPGVVGGRTYFYRLHVTEGGCERVIGPLSVFVGSGSSSGIDGGLESGLDTRPNESLGARLARRAVARTAEARLSPAAWASIASTRSRLDGERSPLADLLPPEGPGTSAPVDATPGDLPALTNARDVVAADYIDAEGMRVASVLVLESVGAPYDHAKALCDRAGGAELDVADTTWVAEVQLPRFGLLHRNGARDHAMEVRLYARDDGAFDLHGAWLASQLPEATPTQRVLTVQVWSPVPGHEVTLLEELLARVALGARLGAAPPRAHLSAIAKRGGEITLHTLGEHAPGDALRVTRRDERGELTTDTLPLEGREALAAPGVLDATVELVDATGEVLDRTWVSDGAWTLYDDGLWGGQTAVHAFSDGTDGSGCGDAPPAPFGALAFAGCARTHASVDEAAGVARHFGGGASNLDLAGFGALAFQLALEGTTSVEVCLESRDGRRACAETEAEAGAVRLDLGAFTTSLEGAACEGAPLDAVSLLSVTAGGPGERRVEVWGLRFLPGTPSAAACEVAESAPARGCASGTTTGMAGWLAVALFLLVRR
ncbi:MAG: hypothetical protein AAGH15_15650, partial [Myxococcota bacterium]